MNEATEKKSFRDELLEESSKPLTKMDRVKGLGLAVLFILLCAGMWIRPDILPVETSDFSGRGARKIVRIVEWGWSRPVGTILGVVGLLVACGYLKAGGETASAERKRDPNS